MADSTQILKARLEAAEKEVSSLKLERLKFDNERAAFAMQINDAVEAERKRHKMLTLDNADEAAKAVKEENAALQRQMDLLRGETSKQLNALEVANSRLTTEVDSLRRECAAKNEEVAHAMRDGSANKTNMERVVKELVDRNKRLEEELRRRTDESGLEVSAVIHERESSVKDLLAARRALAVAQDDKSALEAQLVHAKELNQQLLDDVDAVTAKLHSVESTVRDADGENEMLKRDNDALRLDLEVAIGKLEKADGHIKRLSDEVADDNVDLMKIRNQVEHAEEAKMAAIRQKEELVLRINNGTFGAAEEADRLAIDVEEMVLSVKEVLAHAGQIDPSAVVRVRLPETKPAPGSKGDEAALQSMIKLRDLISMIREDVVLSHRALMEEAKRNRELQLKCQTFEEGHQQERAQVMEVTSRLAAMEENANAEREKAREMEKAMQESSVWMAEAVAMSDERTRRMESLLDEKEAVEEKVARKDAECESLRARVQELATEIGELEVAANKNAAENRRREGEFRELDAELARTRGTVSVLKSEVDTLQHTIADSKDAAAQQRQRIAALESENAQLHRNMGDLDRVSRTRHAQIDKMEGENHNLQDRLFASQKRLDDALRREALSVSSPTPRPGTPSRALNLRDESPLKRAAAGGVTPAGSAGAAAQATPPGAQPAAIVGQSKVRDWEARLNAILLK